MKMYLIQALLIGIFGMLLLILNLALGLELVGPLVLPILLIFAVALSETLITFKLSAGLPASEVMFRVLQTTIFSTVITNLPMLASAGYLWFLRTEQPERVSIQTAYTNYYRDAPEVAFDVFVLMTLIGVVLSVILSFAARYFSNTRFISKLSDKTA